LAFSGQGLAYSGRSALGATHKKGSAAAPIVRRMRPIALHKCEPAQVVECDADNRVIGTKRPFVYG
jgi:hypothetical protein